MKSFFALAASSAIVAATTVSSQSDDVMNGIFLTSFGFGMTGVNYYKTISECVIDTNEFVEDIFSDIMLYKKGKPTRATMRLTTTLATVPSKCPEEVLDLIWGSALPAIRLARDTQDLVESINSHWDKTEAKVLSLVNEMETSWDQREPYKAGQALSKILKLAYSLEDSESGATQGQKKKEEHAPQLVSLPQLPEGAIKYNAGMIGAFFEELIYLNRLDALKGCPLDTMEVAKSVKPIWDDITNGDEGSAFSKAVVAAAKMAEAVKECKQAPKEAKLLGDWFIAKIGTKDRAVEAVTAQSAVHSQEITIRVEEVWATFFTFDQPVVTGQSLGKTAYWALGPIDPDSANF